MKAVVEETNEYRARLRRAWADRQDAYLRLEIARWQAYKESDNAELAALGEALDKTQHDLIQFLSADVLFTDIKFCDVTEDEPEKG